MYTNGGGLNEKQLMSREQLQQVAASITPPSKRLNNQNTQSIFMSPPIQQQQSIINNNNKPMASPTSQQFSNSMPYGSFPAIPPQQPIMIQTTAPPSSSILFINDSY